MTRALSARIGAALSARRRTVAVAESCTGGGVCAALTDIPGSSAYFLGGVVAYSDDSKARDLGVPRDLLESHGAVSGEVALAMAEGVRRRFGADVGVGTTGIAGPGGGTAAKPVGTVFVGISCGDVRLSHRLRLAGDRDSVRAGTVVSALETLLGVLSDGGGEGR